MIQAKAYGIIEYEKTLYVVGSCIPESDSIYEQDLHISKYGLNGNLIKDLLFEHNLPKGVRNATADQSISIWKNELLISHKIQANIHDAITRVDK